MTENIAQRYPKARKAHHCDFCGGRIEVGEQYSVSVHVDGRDMNSWKAHNLCEQFYAEYCDNEPIGAGEIWEALRNVTLADVSGTDWGSADNNSRAVQMWHEANDD